MNVQNFATFDPFADEGDALAAANNDVRSQSNYIHVRVQQRNRCKTLTTLQGLPKGEYEFACNGTLVEDEEAGQRLKISTFLVEEV
ncbi:hypothetical protein BC835DRAFT_1536601 [Cytidiella melzeri]|nr:hypothetical protein BC835DRAFT_1536601 [Cytidiella melzeri]